MPSYESKNVKLDYTGSFPDKLKLIKTINVFPLEVTLCGALNPRSNEWSYSVGARDTLIGGRVTYNKDSNCVEYRCVPAATAPQCA